jgi:hypothetical protein
MWWPGVGVTNPLFSVCRALWRPTAPASRSKSRRTAEESRTKFESTAIVIHNHLTLRKWCYTRLQHDFPLEPMISSFHIHFGKFVPWLRENPTASERACVTFSAPLFGQGKIIFVFLMVICNSLLLLKGQHISTFRGYKILFSIRNPYKWLHQSFFYSFITILPSESGVTLDYSTIFP